MVDGFATSFPGLADPRPKKRSFLFGPTPSITRILSTLGEGGHSAWYEFFSKRGDSWYLVSERTI